MSGWRLVVREMADRGGTLDIADFRTVDNAANHLQQLKRWGFVTGPKRGGSGPWIYTLTPKGWCLASGRLEPLCLTNQTGRGDPRHWAKRRFTATWLLALPETNQVRIGDQWVP